MASVYQYFPNKESITAALMTRHMQKQGELFETVLITHQGHDFDVLSEVLLSLVMDIF